MSGKPAARVTDPTACPLPGHGTNPIASGSPNVNFDGLAAARMTDKISVRQPDYWRRFLDGVYQWLKRRDPGQHRWARQCGHWRVGHGHHW